MAVRNLEIGNKEEGRGLREVIIEGCRSWGLMKNKEKSSKEI